MAKSRILLFRGIPAVFILVSLTLFAGQAYAFGFCTELFSPDAKGFLQVLKEFRGNDDTTTDRQLRGGEGQIYVSLLHPTLALKRFHNLEKQNPWWGVKLLEDARTSIANSYELSNLLEVVQIYDRGFDWILRDFDGASLPIKEVMSDPVVADMIKSVLQALSESSDPALIRVRTRLDRSPPSINIHWSPRKNKIYIFDLTWNYLETVDSKNV